MYNQDPYYRMLYFPWNTHSFGTLISLCAEIKKYIEDQFGTPEGFKVWDEEKHVIYPQGLPLGH